ncbi:MAG: hypothetical protein KC414_05510 [Romboutsia sp.]|nr:hypothetical protein [Romboutsia sp.]
MQPKLYPCNNCGKKVPIRSKGLCPMCRDVQRKELGEKPIYTNKIKPISDKRKEIRKEERGCLTGYFNFHLQNLEKNPYSEESGTFISEPTTANVCHIIDKGRHKSVQCHLSNCIYLTLSEHNRMDKLLFEHRFEDFKKEFPKAFKLYVIRYIKLRQIIKETTKFLIAFDSFLENNK